MTAERALLVVATYASLIWIYVCGCALNHPATLGTSFTHFASWPHEGTVGAVSFCVGAAAFGAARVLGLFERDRRARSE